MKKKISILLFLCIVSAVNGCGKEPADSEYVNDILRRQKYIKISFGQSYHQEKVLFDVTGKKAVVPGNTEWGRPEFREGAEAGIFYGAEEGGERYQTDLQTTPELYLETFLTSIENLNLKVSDIKKENYVVKVVKQTQLRLFAAELVKLTNIVVKNNYKLTGVEIEFDKQCRPVRKIFRLQGIDGSGWKWENDSLECMQEFSYTMRKMKFMVHLRKCKKMI